MERAGLFTQLRNPPGGRDARIMLTAQFLDRTGTGVWSASAVLGPGGASGGGRREPVA